MIHGQDIFHTSSSAGTESVVWEAVIAVPQTLLRVQHSHKIWIEIS